MDLLMATRTEKVAALADFTFRFDVTEHGQMQTIRASHHWDNAKHFWVRSVKIDAKEQVIGEIPLAAIVGRDPKIVMAETEAWMTKYSSILPRETFGGICNETSQNIHVEGTLEASEENFPEDYASRFDAPFKPGDKIEIVLKNASDETQEMSLDLSCRVWKFVK